jgi:hypothetical protein
MQNCVHLKAICPHAISEKLFIKLNNYKKKNSLIYLII